MDVAAFVISCVALIVTTANMIFPRIEYRRSGPLIEVEFVHGAIMKEGGMLNLLYRESRGRPPVGMMIRSDFDWKDKADTYSAWGVHVRNKGRGVATVRSIVLENEYEVPEKIIEAIKALHGEAANIQTTNVIHHHFSHGELLCGPDLGFLLNGNSDDFWAISCMPYVLSGHGGKVRFIVVLGGGQQYSTDWYPYSDLTNHKYPWEEDGATADADKS